MATPFLNQGAVVFYMPKSFLSFLRVHSCDSRLKQSFSLTINPFFPFTVYSVRKRTLCRTFPKAARPSRKLRDLSKSFPGLPESCGTMPKVSRAFPENPRTYRRIPQGCRKIIGTSPRIPGRCRTIAKTSPEFPQRCRETVLSSPFLTFSSSHQYLNCQIFQQALDEPYCHYL